MLTRRIKTSGWRGRLLFTFAILLFAATANGQGNGVMRTDLIAPSPTAANLGKYGDLPVTYYTGLPAVSIPIFEVKGNELSLPIKLSYNFNGHQPAQKASWVGLGWSLMAGGVITRTIGDKVETSGVGYSRSTASQVEPSQTYLQQSYNYSTYDNKPDIYSFNFGEYSGKFIMHNNVAYIMPAQKLHITGGAGTFRIVTEDGTVYQFNEMEQANSKPIAGAPYTLPTHGAAWYLTRITNASGTESIRLTYDDDGVVLRFGPQTQSYNKLINSTQGLNPSAMVPGPINQVFPTRVFSKRLSSIVSDKHTVIFSAGEQRQDLEVEGGSSRCLGGISIYSNDNDKIKQVDFTYEYFGAGPTQHMKYLKLKSLSEQGTTGSQGFMKHSFDYYNEAGSFGAGISTHVDKYGYMLGAGHTTGYISNEIYPGGSNRDPSFGSAVTGALKTITYPTGGSTTFTYEQNVMFDGEKYVINELYAGDIAFRATSTTTNQIVKDTPPFEIRQTQQVPITFSRQDKVPYEPGVSPAEVDHDNVQEVEVRRFHYIYHESDGSIVGQSVGSAVYSGRIVWNADNGGKTETITLEPGRYVLRVICDRDETSVSGNLTYKYHTDIPIVGKPGPGIRMREMANNDANGNVMRKRYSYVNHKGFSTGTLLQSNYYDAREYEQNYYTVLQPLYSVGHNRFISYTSSLSETHGIGLPFYYGLVTEEAFTDEETHRTKYGFSYFPGTQAVELISKESYAQNGDEFVAKAVEEHTFSNEVSDIGFVAMNVFVDVTYIYQPDPELYTDHYGFSHDIYTVNWKHPRTTREVQIEGTKELIVDSRSYYDARRNKIGQRVTTSDGTSVYTKYKYPEDYTGVLPVATLLSNNMKSTVIEEQTWKTRLNGDSVMTAGKINVYQGLHLSDIYVFESTEEVKTLTSETMTADRKFYTSLISDNRYKKKVHFTYDGSARVTSQQPTDKMPVSYVWGYAALTGSLSPGTPMTYPIAEAKNALPDSVFHTSFEDASGVPSAHAITGRKIFNGSFSIPGSYAGRYRLTYWKKPSAAATGWVLVESFHYSPAGISISEPGYDIDEIRLAPVKAQVTTYTYVKDQVFTQTDANNRVTYFEYDPMGRLACVRDHEKNIVKSYNYRLVTEHTLDQE